MVTNELTTVVMVVVVPLEKDVVVGTTRELEVVLRVDLDVVRVDTDVGLGIEVGMVVTDGTGTGARDEEELWEAPRPARPKTVRMVENFIVDIGGLFLETFVGSRWEEASCRGC